MRTLSGIAALALLLAPVSHARADQACKPAVGHFEASIVPPGQEFCPPTALLCTSGRVWGGIQGTYQFVMTAQYPSILLGGVPTVLFFTGRSTVFLKSGDEMTGTDTGSIDVNPANGGFASLITFDGPSSSAPGAGGQIRLRGEFDPAAGATSGDYLGRVCTP